MQLIMFIVVDCRKMVEHCVDYAAKTLEFYFAMFLNRFYSNDFLLVQLRKV